MHQYGYIGRKMRQPKLKKKPAIVIAAFGSSRRGKVALELFQDALKKKFPKYEIFWAYTSEIIRKKTSQPSLQETLARVEAAGYRRAIVQPLHIFPGTEYQQLSETCSFFPGLRIIIGETLCHRWDFILKVLEFMKEEFLPPQEGLNLLALHGTPLAADPVNMIYLGLARLLEDRYPNVLACSVEGIPHQKGVLRKIQRKKLAEKYKQVKIIPMMYLAGIHVEDDLIGDEDSWRTTLEGQGFSSVYCPTITHGKSTYNKGLAFYPECVNFFLQRIERALKLIAHY